MVSVDEARGDEAIRRIDDLDLALCRRDILGHAVDDSIFDENIAILGIAYAAINRDDRRVSEQERRHDVLQIQETDNEGSRKDCALLDSFFSAGEGKTVSNMFLTCSVMGGGGGGQRVLQQTPKSPRRANFRVGFASRAI